MPKRLDDLATHTPLPKSVIALLGDRLVNVAQPDSAAKEATATASFFMMFSFLTERCEAMRLLNSSAQSDVQNKNAYSVPPGRPPVIR